MIRSIKGAVRKSLGVRCLSRSELETTLHEIEMCINSRPLTFVGDEPDVSNPLTPSHFLIGHSGGFQIPSTEVEFSNVSLPEKNVFRQQQLDKFWSMWSLDYLRNLPPATNSVDQHTLQVGSVVLVREDNIPRLKWPLAVFQVEELT